MSVVFAVDVGTTGLKCGVVRDGVEVTAAYSTHYPLVTSPDGKAEIDPHDWWDALLSGCHHCRHELREVEAVCFSSSTPGTLAMDGEGTPLTHAVPFMDGRSHRQSQWIRERVGEDTLLKYTANLPVSGGCTASTLLWWKDHEPAVFHRAAMFGHTHTFIIKRLTGAWCTDPSTASLAALYNTSINDKSWNAAICDQVGIPIEKLPPVFHSWEAVGNVLPLRSEETGLPRDIPVVIGGNDAMCAALSAGITYEGAVMNICGTCEIICIGLAKPLPGSQYNVRCHVIPKMWSTLYVLNTGGKALEWFHQTFCREMSIGHFFDEYIPPLLQRYFDDPDAYSLPEYEVYLAGDRYSVEPKFASFQKLNLATTREAMLLSLIQHNNLYLRKHFDEVSAQIALSHRVHLTGGGLSEIFIQCKRRWIGEYEYIYRENSSMMGAALLGHYALTGKTLWDPAKGSGAR